MGLGANIKRIRLLKKWSVKDLADKMGINPQSIYDWEKEKYEPVKENLESIARVLGVPLKEFYDDNSTYVDLPTKKEKDPDEHIRILIKNLDRMGELNEYLLKELKRLQGG